MLRLGISPGSHCDPQASLSSQTTKPLFSHLNDSVTDTASPPSPVVPSGMTWFYAKLIFVTLC